MRRRVDQRQGFLVSAIAHLMFVSFLVGHESKAPTANRTVRPAEPAPADSTPTPGV